MVTNRFPLRIAIGIGMLLALTFSAGELVAVTPGGNGRIAFIRSVNNAFDIFTMNVDGSGETNITNHPANDTNPAWSPDGTQMAFTSNRDGNTEVYVMNEDGSAQTRLTNNSVADFQPAWSPDGTKIAFVSDRASNF